jgi:hypothetical protein
LNCNWAIYEHHSGDDNAYQVQGELSLETSIFNS